MHKTWGLLFLAAIFTISGAQYFDSPSKVEGAESEAFRGSMIAYRQGLVKQVYSTTNNAISIKLQDLPVGKIIQIGDATNGLKFVKISDNQYLSIAPQCPDPVLTTTGAQKLFTYTGNYQSYTFYAGCEYKIELWGASGNGDSNYSINNGYGGYVSGNIVFYSRQNLYLYLGSMTAENRSVYYTFNGGGNGETTGGGATDVRLVNGNWDDNLSLNSRIIVAGAGGGGFHRPNSTNMVMGNAGGLSGANASCTYAGQINYQSYGGSQIAGGIGGLGSAGYIFVPELLSGKFGKGGMGFATNLALENASKASGGGAGYYGGGHGTHPGGGWTGGSGGSSYISGHTGCVAIAEGSTSEPRTVRKTGCTTGTSDNECSLHYSGLSFTNTVMIDGAGYQWTNVKGALKQMPNPTGGNYASGVGHTGNGYARITRLN